MTFKNTKIATYAAALCLMAGTASAAPLGIGFGTFDDLSTEFVNTVTFGGSGIGTTPGSISSLDVGTSSTLRFGILATPRFSSPALGNDGAGTFTAGPGTITAGTPPSTGALWNFSFAAEIIGTEGLTFGDLDLLLYYDLDAGVDTDIGDLGVIDLSASVLTSGLNFLEGSQNNLFSFLTTSNPTLGLTAPSATFDPNANGEYSFGLVSGRTAASINVNVAASPVPLPAGLPMLLVGLGAFGVMARRRKT